MTSPNCHLTTHTTDRPPTDQSKFLGYYHVSAKRLIYYRRGPGPVALRFAPGQGTSLRIGGGTCTLAEDVF